MDSAGVGGGETADGAVRAKVEVTRLDGVEEIIGVGRRLREDVTKSPAFMVGTGAKKCVEGRNDGGLGRGLEFSTDIRTTAVFVFHCYEGQG